MHRITAAATTIEAFLINVILTRFELIDVNATAYLTAAPAAGRRGEVGDAAGAGAGVLRGFADLMPDRNKLAKRYPELAADTRGRTERAPAKPAGPGRGKRGKTARGRGSKRR